MIRKANTEDLETVVGIIRRLNPTTDFYSTYMSGDVDRIRRDVTRAIETGTVNVCIEKGTMAGVVVFGKYDALSKDYDVTGPYVPSSRIEVAKRLMEATMEPFDRAVKFNVFFDAKSRFYKRLMATFKARFKNYEYLLELHEPDFKPALANHPAVHQMKPEEKAEVKAMHDLIFPDAYITGEALINAKDVYVLTRDKRCVGYALVRSLETKCYLEVFALKKAHRGRGLGKEFLSSVIAHAFKTPSHTRCDLVVDRDNLNALGLYQAIGFKVAKKNVAYQLEKKAD